MTNFTEGFLFHLKLRQELLYAKAFSTMQMNLVLYIVVAVLMALVILSFVCFVAVIRCRRRRRKEQRCSDWVRSASIEHLRFRPEELEAHRVRTSTPHDFEMTSIADFIRLQNNNRGDFYSGGYEYINPFEYVNYPVEMQEIQDKSRPVFQTFGGGSEPKYIYWETRV